MNKFKAFFTFLAFAWLWLCGFWGIYALFSSANPAWVGLVINAWALPIWMAIRYWQPEKTTSDLRESPAFAGVLLGLGIALLTDAQKGLPVYLAIYNLFVVLIYLFHLSALRYPPLPSVNAHFPVLTVCNHGSVSPAELCSEAKGNGVLLVFLRGPFCAASRTLLTQLRDQEIRFQERRVSLLLAGVQPRSQWPETLLGKLTYWQLDSEAQENSSFVVHYGAPAILWAMGNTAVRPGIWLLDYDGYIAWRHLPENYRVPGSGDLVADQLFRLDE